MIAIHPTTAVAINTAQPPYVEDPFLNKEENALQRDLAEIGFQKGLERLHKAIGILEKSEIGRSGLEACRAHDFVLTLDARPLAAMKAQALCDTTPGRKRIVMDPTSSLTDMLHSLLHEPEHAIQSDNGLFPHDKFHIAPLSWLRRSRAIEAAAVAREVTGAYELKDVYPPLWDSSLSAMAPVAKAVEIAVQSDPSALKNGRAMAAGFEAFYDMNAPQLYVERMVAEEYTTMPPKFAQHPESLKETPYSSRELKSLLTFNGEPYLEKYAPDMDLEKPRYSGVDESTAIALRDLQSKRQGVTILHHKPRFNTDEPLWDIQIRPRNNSFSVAPPVSAPQKPKPSFWRNLMSR